MKPAILFYLLMLLNFQTKAQSSSKELGEKIFLAFKYDSINLINNYRLKIEELSSFFIANGLDTNSNQFKNYESKYAAISEQLINTYKKIQTDSLANNITWKEAELVSVTLKDKEGNSIPDDKMSNSKILEIVFISNENKFLLIVEALKGNDNLWKVGNMINQFPNANKIAE